MTDYAELQVTTNFSFLRGASHPGELVLAAKQAGLSAIAVTDHNSLAGLVRGHLAATEVGIRFVPSCRLDLRDGTSLLCYPRDRAAYGRLCLLLTTGQRRAGKGDCDLGLEDVAAHAEGQIFILLPPEHLADDLDTRLRAIAERLAPAPVYLAAHHLYRGDDRRRIACLARAAEQAGTHIVATNDVHYHAPSRRPLQDVLTCIREKCTIAEAGARLAANAERHIKPADRMLHLFRGHEDAVARTREIVEACTFSLAELRYEYPDEPVPAGRTPQDYLTEITWQGAQARYPDGIPDKVARSIVRELELIARLDYARYFLTVYDIVRFARSREPEILCQGRGSAANSVVCYCLGITSVNPVEIDLLFERFVSESRNEPPDIDVDFEHERREEVIQYIYERYGREHAGLAATVITYRSRSAVRDVGKVMGLSEDVTSALAGTVWGSSGEGIPEARVRELGLDPDDPLLSRTLALAGELIGFPRHLSQHVGGFVLTRSPLCETVPIGNAAMENRTVIEWDKDDIDSLGILKVDVLGLGMLTCIRKSFDLLRAHHGRELTLATVPREDPAVYDMLCRADSIGVFQVESRAQMNMLPRLKPRCFYDLVIEVAIVRPGPIHGDMVHPYLRRRDGLEPEEYPAPHPDFGPPDELSGILGRTKGVPLFQEQAMRLAMVAAEFTEKELNELRRAMATFRRRGTIERLRGKMVGRMVERGYDPGFAERCFDQIKGFGEYGFPESHAASFALLVYVSAWLKCHYPEVFAAALLNSQPMGFYAPAQIVRDAVEHGVEARAVDVNHSDWDCTLEPADTGWALRLGMRQVDGLRKADAEAIVAARASRKAPFASVGALWRQAGVSPAALERLAAADAFRSMGLDRRAALWEVRALADTAPLPLFARVGAPERGPEPPIALPEMPLGEHVVNDYQTLRLSLKAHPMVFLRERFAAERVLSTADLRKRRDGQPAVVAGLVLVRQRPGSASGVIFMTLEDEFGIANIVVWPAIMERFRRAVIGGRLVVVRGRVQRHEDIIHVVAREIVDRSADLYLLSRDAPVDGNPLSPDDHAPHSPPGNAGPGGRRHPRQERIFPRSRDFH